MKAPGLRSSASRRVPIDLVTVLDVSQGEKLQILKRGMRLVVLSFAVVGLTTRLPGAD